MDMAIGRAASSPPPRPSFPGAGHRHESEARRGNEGYYFNRISRNHEESMTVHALNDQEISLLRNELEMLMQERQKLLRVTGAAAVLVANLDIESLPHDQETIDAAEMLGEGLNGLAEETLNDALRVVGAEIE